MDKKQLNTLLRNKWYLLELVRKLIISDYVDRTSSIVFWIITPNQKTQLTYLISGNKEIDNTIKYLWVCLLKIISSNVHTYKQKSLDQIIHDNLKNSWRALEVFLVDAIMRNRKNDNLKAYTCPVELDRNKIDFIVERAWIKYWIQLTTSNFRKTVQKKRREIKSIPDFNPQKEELSSSFRFESWILITIGGEITKILKKQRQDKKNIFQLAYQEWEKDWYKEWWPNQYLDEEIKNQLFVVAKSIEELMKQFIQYILKNNYDSNKINWHKIQIEERKDWAIKVNLFKEKHLVYSMEFFFTDSFLQKLLSTEIPSN